jgi:hypothetical protein
MSVPSGGVYVDIRWGHYVPGCYDDGMLCPGNSSWLVAKAASAVCTAFPTNSLLTYAMSG